MKRGDSGKLAGGLGKTSYMCRRVSLPQIVSLR
jgi:hypothetical protein